MTEDQRRKRTVCVDLDGVLLKYDGWQGPDHFGEILPGAIEFLQKLRKTFWVVIFTVRVNPEVNEMSPGFRRERPGTSSHIENLGAWAHVQADMVAEFLTDNCLEFDEVYHGIGKPLCSAFIDDRNVSIKTNEPDYKGAIRWAKALHFRNKKNGVDAPAETENAE